MKYDYKHFPLIDPNNKIVMGWAAKSGCTIAVKMFFDHMDILEEAEGFSDGDKAVHDFRMLVFYDRYGKPTNRHFSDSTYFKFKVVRNPFERAVSSFIHYVEHCASNPCSFVDFVRFLKTENLEDCDAHWKLQLDGFDDKYDKIIKLEDMAEGIKKINILRGTKFRTNFTSGHHHIKKDAGEFVGYKKFICGMIKTIPSYNNFYNDVLKEDIAKLYNKDIAGLGL